jgi:predicted transcriptional regulator
MLALENEDGPKVCRDELALQLNLKQRSLGNNLTTLEKAGLIFFDSKTVTLTELGMAQADTSGLVSAAPQNNDEHQQRLMVKYKLSGGEQKVLMELKDGSEKAKAAVAEKLGLKLRSFSNLLTNPKKSGLLEVNGQSIRLSDKMFIKKLGRPCDHN